VPGWSAPVPTYAEPAGYGEPVGPSSTSAKAIASLVLSLVYACGIGSIAAIVLGHLARGEIKRSGGRVGGKGLATAGLVIGYIGLALTLVIGGALTIAAVDDSTRDSGASQDVDPLPLPVPTPAPTPEPAPQPVSGLCPEPSALADVLPAGAEFVLGGSTRSSVNGVVDCVYGQPGQPGGGDLVLVALQDDLTTTTVDAYWTERELDPPTADQLGAAAGSAERFGFDEYESPQSGVPYIDTGAANGSRSAVLSVPASFGIDTPTLFATTVDLLEGIRVPDNVV
jgi:hypothetical protein